MPLYSYICKKCQYRTEELKSVKDIYEYPKCINSNEKCEIEIEIFASKLRFVGDWITNDIKLEKQTQSEKFLDSTEKYTNLDNLGE